MIFVAEIGLNHDGNFNLAYELIRRAKQSGAHIAKFQFGWRHGEGEINQIDAARARQLKDWCDYLGIEMMASIIIDEVLPMAQDIGMQRYKIASRTVIENPALCERVIAEGKETFVSLGWWDKPDFPFGPPTDKLRYIFCKSEYPTYAEGLAELPKSFSADGYYGYSDHCHGVTACLLAITRGAQFVETHFTLDKTSQVIHDHVLSATPEEFAQLTQLGDELSRLVGVIGH